MIPQSTYNYSSSEEINNLIKSKDEEIQKLKDSIEGLTSVNKELEEKVNQLSRENNLDKILEDLEKLTKQSVEDLKSYPKEENKIKITQLETENEKLKKNYQLLESKYILITKEKNVKLDEIDKVNLTKDFNIKSFDKIKDFFNKFENETNNYKEIYSTSRTYLNKLLNKFLNKKELFDSKIFKDNSEQNANNAQYNELKADYFSLSLLNVYYERLLNGFMNRVLIDISNINKFIILYLIYLFI
jgi:chromosome segregation ATPase